MERVEGVESFGADWLHFSMDNFWPVNDQFALVGRDNGDYYFGALGTFFQECNGEGGVASNGNAKRWYGGRAGNPDMLLLRHLVSKGGIKKLRMYDFHQVIVRGPSENGRVEGRCGILVKTHNVLCQIVEGGRETKGAKRRPSNLTCSSLRLSQVSGVGPVPGLLVPPACIL